ncbi:MAG: sugar transferase [Gammaproteobacteria bacterium]|nr:sugar transferase [Gammaproteobacteria bacterium]MBT8436411.1 sugar transferase [Gammaproteobacteria bacterium]
MKRLFDFTLALCLVIILAPLLLVIAILIKLDSSGPAFFRQNRVGLNGKIFSICKFRSMYVSNDPHASYNTLENDPRITRIGRVLRATSIDELPQLYNVLKGDMSIVGPRPDLELQQQDYSPEDWRLRISVRPGVTGLAQINGRSNISFENRLKYDLCYARTNSFMGDLLIILKTFVVVIRGRNTN